MCVAAMTIFVFLLKGGNDDHVKPQSSVSETSKDTPGASGVTSSRLVSENLTNLVSSAVFHPHGLLGMLSP